METPNILDSKIKKLRIELPDYKFSYSSSGDSQHAFIGRERILEKLQQLVEDSPAESGVYLITGNRGVGKTSLVSEVINKTSLQPDTNIFEDVKYFFTHKNDKKNRNRLYLRINFGHKLKDEKDILRLIARTLNTEYNKYHRSFRRMLLWRVIVFVFILIFACLFSITVGQKSYTVNDNEYLKDAFSKIETQVETKVDYADKILSERTTVETKIGSNVGNFSFVINKAVLFLLSFILMYLFYVLLFRCNWITYFFVTHRIIMRRLKKLNSDITHKTELENSIGINNEKIGIRTKKTRNVADAREIEKELQDILNDMQRIPQFICRPNIVIVFDELDKVEPGDASLEKENLQTKASLLSIHATRERQTEILRILSNMKYFLSTVKAKFIFIAGREMYDIHLADVSERNNYIGSIFNAVIHVPSFLTDHPTGKESIPEESSIASLPEEFVCRRLFPRDYDTEEIYNLKSYKVYLEKVIYKDIQDKIQKKEIVHKIIAVLQQLIIYLAHVSKGAPKKMMQLFESFVEIRNEKDKNRADDFLVVQRDNKSRHFLTFSYYKQYTLGIIAYLITPIFYRLSESNIKEHSDKLLVSSLRFVDFLFKFHKYSFTWKHLDISPEMVEVNRAPELKSVTVDLLNYLAQVHINKSNFSLYDYKFDSLIANEIFAMTKTDEVFSALFSFSLDETLSLKKHYQDMLENMEKTQDDKTSVKYIDAISSLQIVLGDLHYYDDELEVAAVYYKSAVEMLRKPETKKDENEKSKDSDEKNEDDEIRNQERLYLYVRNKLKLGMIHEKRKQYDFAYLTYAEICKRIIRGRDITIKELGAGIVLRIEHNYENDEDNVVFVKTSTTEKINKENKKYYDNIEVPQRFQGEIVKDSIASPQPLYFKDISPNTNDMLFKKMTYEGLKMLYLPFIAKLQILEKSHTGSITRNHLEQLDKEFEFLTYIIDHKEAKLLEAEFLSRVADILYYKNSDLKCKKDKNRKKEDKCKDNNYKNGKLPQNCSCTACYYYHKALSILLGKTELNKPENKNENTIIELLWASVEQLNKNYNMKFCTVLARILSDWGNVFFSCDNISKEDGCGCYIYDENDCNTQKYNLLCAYPTCNINDFEITILKKYIDYARSESEQKNRDALLYELATRKKLTKMEIAFAMYAISLHAYRKANLYKRSSYQIYKMLSLFKHYEVYKSKKSKDYIDQLSEKAINYLWYATENLNALELNKRKKDFGENKIKDKIPLQNLLVDSEITRIRILVKELELKSNLSSKTLSNFYGFRITSPYKINYSIVGRIYRLRLKSIVNYEAYQMLIPEWIDLITKYNDSSGNKSELKSKLDALGAIYNKDIDKYIRISSEIEYILNGNSCNDTIRKIFGDYFDFGSNLDDEKKAKIKIFENLIAETIYCLIDIVQLSETMDETFLFPHSFLGSIHKHLSFWIRRYETYEKSEMNKEESSQIDKYLEKYLDQEWREQLSGYRENQKALSHYYKCLEMHREGRAYHNMIDTMCYLKDDYNDRSDHFNIAEERHFILNGDIGKKIDELKDLYKDSEIYKVKNYFEQPSNEEI